LGLKRLGLAHTTGTAPASTFGGLVTLLSGNSETPVAALPVAKTAGVARTNGALGELQVGLDVEDIRSLPVAADYWEHEFFKGTFARSEIAYAVLQAEPRTHFAGFWCAKEALRKCDGAFVGTNLDLIAVAHDSDGRPYLTVASEAGPERLPHAVSISHTAEVATAVVIANQMLVSLPVVVTPAEFPAAKVSVEAPAPEAKKRSGLARFLGV